MNVFRKVYERISMFTYQNYPLITLFSCLIAIVTAYLHYELKVNKNDLIHWQSFTEICSRDLDYYHLILLCGVILINILFVVIIVLVYLRPINETADISLLEIKNRYVRFIILRLIARLDKIQSKLTTKRNNSNNLAQLRNYIRAHESMAKAVAIFRKDARKVLAPSETDIMLPIEDVFCVAEEEERSLKRAGYYKLPIEFSDEVMKSLINPKY